MFLGCWTLITGELFSKKAMVSKPGGWWTLVIAIARPHRNAARLGRQCQSLLRTPGFLGPEENLEGVEDEQ